MKGELRGRLNVLRPRRVLVSDERFLCNARTALFSTDVEMKVKEKKKNNNNSFSGGTQQQPVHAVHTACLLEWAFFMTMFIAPFNSFFSFSFLFFLVCVYCACVRLLSPTSVRHRVHTLHGRSDGVSAAAVLFHQRVKRGLDTRIKTNGSGSSSKFFSYSSSTIKTGFSSAIFQLLYYALMMMIPSL